MLFYTTSLGPPIGDPTAMYAPPLRYKREALVVHNRLSRSLEHTDAHTLELKLTLDSALDTQDSLEAKAMQHTVDVGYYAPAARTTLNPVCSSCSWSEIELVLANPRILTLWA